MKLRTKEHAFYWSEDKAKLNLRKHGVSFGIAASVFDDPLHSTRYDLLHSDVEDRWITIGRIPNGQLLSEHMIKEESAEDLETEEYDSKQFFRGGHMHVDNGVRRMSIFLDYDLLKYFLIRAATQDERPTDLINNILKRERARLETEKRELR